MFGVVLWSDPDQKRAVIWCEDHGNLAFLSSAAVQGDEICTVEAGDLVKFDIVEGGKVRCAKNARLIETDAYPQLVSNLQSALNRKKEEELQDYEGCEAKVVSFDFARPRIHSKTDFLPNGRRLRSI